MSKIIRGYKYRIYPDEEQSKQIDTFVNFARFVYNWGVAKERELYAQYLAAGKKGKSIYSYFDLEKLYRYERDNNPDMYWVKDYPLTTAKLALRRVYNGYKRFLKGTNIHPPHFKSKKNSKKSFNTRNDTFRIDNDCIKIEGISTKIRLGFKTGFEINGNNKAINPVITKDYLGNHYISFSLEEESSDLDIPKTEGIGIDLGIRRTFTLSTGEMINQPNDKLKRLERRRRKQQSHVTRDINRRMEIAKRTRTKYEDIPKSKRAEKRELRLNKTYRKIHNIKDTFYSQTASYIVNTNPEYVCMETFSTMEIFKRDNYMCKYLSNTSFYDIIRKMKNKCNSYNIPFIQAPREFASTQICSNCGSKKKMHKKHIYKCPVCGMAMDRDINAAINLKNFGLAHIHNV